MRAGAAVVLAFVAGVLIGTPYWPAGCVFTWLAGMALTRV